jgi:hypothetical protein
MAYVKNRDNFVESPKVTYNFINPIGNPHITQKGKTEYGSYQYLGSVAGHYFEYIVLKRLDEHFKKKGAKITNKTSITGQHQRAITIMNYDWHHDPTNPIKLHIEMLKKNVELTADEAAQYFVKEFESELEKSTKKDVTINTVARVQSISGDNPLGDLELMINGKRIILELKWQTTRSTKSTTPIRWFELVESVLFGGNEFYNFAKGRHKRSNYWSYNTYKEQWIKALNKFVLPKYMDDHHGNYKEQLAYLIHKGKAFEMEGQEPFDAKYVVHGTQVQLSIQTTEEFLGSLKTAMEGGQRQFSTKVGAKAKDSGLAYIGGDGEEVASFGVTKLHSDLKEPNKKSKKSKNTASEFSFAMYIAQKYAAQYGAN